MMRRKHRCPTLTLHFQEDWTDEVTELTSLPISGPPNRQWPRSALHLVIAGGLLTAACLTHYARLEGRVAAPSVQPAAIPAMPAPDDLAFFDNLQSWWPRDLGAAAAMLQCRPAPATGSSGSQQQDSILVWVDKANDVMAFGSTREDGSLPAFASKRPPTHGSPFTLPRESTP